MTQNRNVTITIQDHRGLATLVGFVVVLILSRLWWTGMLTDPTPDIDIQGEYVLLLVDESQRNQMPRCSVAPRWPTVRDEFDKQLRAEQVAPRVSIPGATGYGVSVSQGVTAQPTTTRVIRSGLFGTRTVRVPVSSGSGTCRVVNGVRVCN